MPRDGLIPLFLDGIRCGGRDVLVLGVVLGKRVLPVGWAVLSYPWPKRRLKLVACTLLR
jgi:hypothetical protein